MSKRKKVKNPFLKKQTNTTIRQDYIETGYFDGVRNKDGEMVIRPLTDEEKEWMNQYYKEVVNTNDFYPGEQGEKLKEQRQQILKEMKMLKQEGTSDEELALYEAWLKECEDQLEQHRKESGNLILDQETIKELYSDNYKRNNDLYNNLKAGGMLIDVDAMDVRTFEGLLQYAIESEVADVESSIIAIEENEERKRLEELSDKPSRRSKRRKNPKRPLKK